MATLTEPSDAVNKIAAALNLPKNTVAFTLRVRAGEAATLEVEGYAEASGAEELATVLKRYRLEELNWKGLTDEIERLRAENARLAREAHTWSKAAETYAADAERLRSLTLDLNGWLKASPFEGTVGPACPEKGIDMKDWIMKLCPEIAERQAELIADHAAEVAQRKPLPIEQIDRMWADEWDGFVSFEEAKVIVHSVEQAHGIK